MRSIRLAFSAGFLLSALGACAGLPAQTDSQYAYQDNSGGPRHLVQGVFGVMELNGADQQDSDSDIDVDSSDSTLPLLGGVFQQALRGEGLQLGVEGGFTFGFRGDRTTVYLPGGVGVVADNDVLLSDIFGGLYLNKYLGRNLRLYGGAGPLLQYGRVDVEYIDQFNQPRDVKSSGWGLGLYARVGLEVNLGPGT